MSRLKSVIGWVCLAGLFGCDEFDQTPPILDLPPGVGVEALGTPASPPGSDKVAARTSGKGMSLVGQWVENDPNSLFADVWGQEITTGAHAGTYAYIGHFGGEAGVDIIDISNPGKAEYTAPR